MGLPAHVGLMLHCPGGHHDIIYWRRYAPPTFKTEDEHGCNHPGV
jgi:hypothetical protein